MTRVQAHRLPERAFRGGPVPVEEPADIAERGVGVGEARVELERPQHRRPGARKELLPAGRPLMPPITP